jgi:hypothetical protein
MLFCFSVFVVYAMGIEIVLKWPCQIDHVDRLIPKEEYKLGF